MPKTLTTPTVAVVLRQAAIGFCGKIPARGDFVRAGLPSGFTEIWDRWMEQMLASSRAVLGEDWLAAWLEGPVWRFVLTPGSCGPEAALGLWMPSVDCVGRHFPLTLAAVAPDADPRRLVIEGGGFLAAAEDAGRVALANDLPPEALAARLEAARTASPVDPGIDLPLGPLPSAMWWTEGAPIVAAGSFGGDALPNKAVFAAMLDGRTGGWA